LITWLCPRDSGILDIMEHPADANLLASARFIASAASGDLATVRRDVDKMCTETINGALCESVLSNALHVVEFLAVCSADAIDIWEEHLIMAASLGNLDMIKFFLSLRSDENREVGPSEWKEMALCYAAEFGRSPVVEYLTERGANVNFLESEPLCKALQSGHFNVVKYLVENGASIHARDGEPICIAATSNIDIVKFLVEKGANLHAQNDRPMARAILNERDDIARFFISAGVCTSDMIGTIRLYGGDVYKINAWLKSHNLGEFETLRPIKRALGTSDDEHENCVITFEPIALGGTYRACSGIRAHVLSGEIQISGKYATICPVCTCRMLDNLYVNE